MLAAVALRLARLAELTFKQVLNAVSYPSRGSDYLASRFQALVEFYTEASAGKYCVFIHEA